MFSGKYLYHEPSFSNKCNMVDYENSKKKYNYLLLLTLVLHVFMVNGVGLMLNSLNNEVNWIKVAYVTIFPVLCLSFSYMGYKKPQCSAILLVILALISFFSIMERYYSNKSTLDATVHFLVGMNKEIIGISLILAKIPWKISSAFQLLINLFCAFRYLNFETNYDMKFFPLIQMISVNILTSFCAYFLEKYEKENCERIKKYEYSLYCFKDLITTFLPSALLIIKEEEILFFNEKTLNILECEGESTIWSRLGSLKLDELFEKSDKKITKENAEDCNSIMMEGVDEETFKIPMIMLSQSTSPRTFCCRLDLGEKSKSLEISIAKIIWENKMAVMIIISENEILERIKYINEKSEYKDRLLATVSHDLRTPLNGIMGMIRTTIDVNQDKQTKKYLNIALHSSQLLLLMINDILDYSQISNGKLRLNFEKFCLWSLIKDVSKLFKFQTKTKGLNFIKQNFAVEANLGSFIRSDKNRIKQVLFNLLGNALKFTSEGSIKISLRPWLPKDNRSINSEKNFEIKKALAISVEDTGIGIKKEDQGSLFKLFGKLQTENTATLNKNGVGLGLAISQSLVKFLNNYKQDGEITVVSEYKRGSCFSFVIFSEEGYEETRGELNQRSFEEKSDRQMKENLAVIKRDFEKVSRNNSFMKISSNLLKKKKILVVDDDQINILVVSSYLKDFYNYEFDVCFDGEDAIEILRKKAEDSIFYDVILMDCNMPKMNGSEAVSIIDHMINRNQIPPLLVIICTANACLKDYELTFRGGTIDYLTKPFTKEQIRKKIEGDS